MFCLKLAFFPFGLKSQVMFFEAKRLQFKKKVFLWVISFHLTSKTSEGADSPNYILTDLLISKLFGDQTRSFACHTWDLIGHVITCIFCTVHKFAISQSEAMSTVLIACDIESLT